MRLSISAAGEGRGSSPFSVSRFIAACITAAVAWLAVEVCGGLLFLGMGVRLWRYELMPLWSDITSPISWLFAAAFIVPLTVAFDRRVTVRLSGAHALVADLAFLMTAGPVLELVFNEYIFRHAIGRPLYVYLVLPTVGGSGSLLSPLYYATLLIHRPICARLLSARRTAPPFASHPARDEYPAGQLAS